ncbi:TadE family protein [Arthrobacter livingstonensis]|uniref:TadE family protein n=1 Tax=Arthrobacter livingstonensis TaxID=670078 RepID=UPI001FE5DFAD|nr:TadE family protein [Arthrobacter livingstonensis]
MDFVLVSAIVTIMFLALIQLALVLHVRNTVADAASSAARYGALADRTAQDAQDRAELLIGTALGSGFAQEVSATVSSVNGVSILTVSVTAPMPLLGLLGPGRQLEMSGHAVIAR